MASESPRPAADYVRRTARRGYGGGRAPTEYERTILGGTPIDMRTGAARLFKAIEDALHDRLGGREALGVHQLGLARRAAALWVECEQSERALVEGREYDLASYRATCAELRRVLEALGLTTRAAQGGVRQPSPGDAYAQALIAAEEAERGS